MSDLKEKIDALKQESKQEEVKPLCTIEAVFVPGHGPVVRVDGDLLVADGLIDYIYEYKDIIKQRFREHQNPKEV